MENIVKFENLGLIFHLNRIAFSIFGINIYWYGLIIATGLIIAFMYAIREAEKVNLSQDDLLNLFLIAVPCAIIGARLYYVIFSFSDYRNDLASIFNLREGGLAVYGGIIAATVAIFIYCKIRYISPYKVLDILAVGLLIGQGIGRWGNFVNGEAFGAKTSSVFAMTIISDGAKIAKGVHPTFLYESLWNFFGLIVLILYKKKKKFEGELISLYMVWYGLGRVWIEALRADSLYMGNIKISQFVSLILLIFGIFFIIKGRLNKKEL